jgi:hypothetical protein
VKEEEERRKGGKRRWRGVEGGGGRMYPIFKTAMLKINRKSFNASLKFSDNVLDTAHYMEHTEQITGFRHWISFRHKVWGGRSCLTEPVKMSYCQSLKNVCLKRTFL